MFDENERLWIHLKRLFRIFPVCVVLWLWFLNVYQEEYFGYLLHRNDYRVVEAQVVSLDMVIDKGLRGKRYGYLTQVKLSDGSEKETVLHRDTGDYVGKVIKVAVGKSDPEDVRRVKWLHGKGSVRVFTWVQGIIALMLLFVKILSHIKLKKTWRRIDRMYEQEVKAKREELLQVGDPGKGALVTKVIREANDNVTLESVRIKCRLTETGETIKSPVFFGHAILREGDCIMTDNDISDNENVIDWAKYMV